MSKTVGAIFIGAGLSVMLRHLGQASHPTSWLDFTVGVFWLLVGASCFWNGVSRFNSGRRIQ